MTDARTSSDKETEDEPPSPLPKESEIDRRRTDPRTYTEPLLGSTDTHDVKDFLMYFYKYIVFQKDAEQTQRMILHDNPVVGEFYHDFVTTKKQMTEEDFWQRYYYRLEWEPKHGTISSSSSDHSKTSAGKKGKRKIGKKNARPTRATESTMELLHLAQAHTQQAPQEQIDLDPHSSASNSGTISGGGNPEDSSERETRKQEWLQKQLEGNFDNDETEEDAFGASRPKTSALLVAEDGALDVSDAPIKTSDRNQRPNNESTMELLQAAQARTEEKEFVKDDDSNNNDASDSASNIDTSSPQNGNLLRNTIMKHEDKLEEMVLENQERRGKHAEKREVKETIDSTSKIEDTTENTSNALQKAIWDWLCEVFHS